MGRWRLPALAVLVTFVVLSGAALAIAALYPPDDGNSDTSSATPLDSPLVEDRIGSRAQSGDVDTDDVYSVRLEAGDGLYVRLAGRHASTLRLRVLGPRTTIADRAVAQVDRGAPKEVRYIAEEAGTHYIDVWNGAAPGVEGIAGSYELTFRRTPRPSADPGNGTFPGTPVAASGTVTGSADYSLDPHDMFALTVPHKDDRLDMWLASPLGTDFDLSLFGPGTSSLGGWVARSNTGGYPETVTYVASSPGTYTMDVAASPKGWFGPYTLEYALTHPTACSLHDEDRVVAYGQAGHVSGMLTSHGAPLAGKTVSLQQATPKGKWIDTGLRKVTDEAGWYGFRPAPRTKARYRVRFDGAGGYAPSWTGTVTIVPTVHLTTPVAKPIVKRDAAFGVVGYLRPRHLAGERSVVLNCFHGENGKWVLRKTVWGINEDDADRTKYVYNLTLPTSGYWRIIAKHSDPQHPAVTASSVREVWVE